MAEPQLFYLCPTCFAVRESSAAIHEHPMVPVAPRLLDNDLRRPPVDEKGRMQSRAPRWFLQMREGQHTTADRQKAATHP